MPRTGEPSTDRSRRRLSRHGIIHRRARRRHCHRRGSGTGSGRTQAKTRFFGVFRVDPQKYGRDLTRLQQEILPHLADPDTGDLTITVEIEATRPDGFADDKIRIVTENARVLKFEQSDFE